MFRTDPFTSAKSCAVRTKNKIARLHIALGVVVCFAAGCGRGIEIGKPLAFPTKKDVAVFGINGVTQSSMTNRSGIPIPGLVLHQASLIRNATELPNSHHERYVIFHDFLLGNLVTGAYWEQQSAKRVGLGLAAMNTHATPVTVVKVDSNRVVLESKKFRAAHVRVSVDTNDFTRQFVP